MVVFLHFDEPTILPRGVRLVPKPGLVLATQTAYLGAHLPTSPARRASSLPLGKMPVGI